MLLAYWRGRVSICAVGLLKGKGLHMCCWPTGGGRVSICAVGLLEGGGSPYVLLAY